MKTIVPVNRLPAISRTALRTAVSVVLALTALAGCDKASGLEFDDDTPQGMVTIAALKSRCTGAQAAVTEDITVEGVVTGNDLYGEFYKTLVVEDTSGGISIAVDATELYVDYPVGTAVTIHCNGLFLCDYGGKVMLGISYIDIQLYASADASDEKPSKYPDRSKNITARQRAYTKEEMIEVEIDG